MWRMRRLVRMGSGSHTSSRLTMRKKTRTRQRIWMTSTSGGDAIALTNEDANSTRPRWSPDGKSLGFLSERGNKKKQVWLLPRGGGEAEQLTNTVQDVNVFEWSPAGNRVILVLQDRFA